MSENSQTLFKTYAKFIFMKRDDAYFEAMKARDFRFDGKFFVGVKTTGIYCRPICPAKPKRENVEFFQSYHEAERFGYRPCLRCRPESAPHSPVWLGKSAVVNRAMKLLHDPTFLELNENEFADKLGLTARHLRRLFQEEIGKTPKQIGFENRLNLARKLITETALSMTEIAYASGFYSIRRFNDAYKDRFKKNPLAARRKKIRASDTLLKISLSYRPPFDFRSLLASYESHRIGELEWFEDGKMFRVVESHTKFGTIAISNDEKNSCVWVEIDFPDHRALQEILGRVRALFDLDSDPVLIANQIEQDPSLKKIFKKYPGLRVPSGWDTFEIAIGAILGQLVSIAQGRALMSSLIENLGEEIPIIRNGKAIKRFPSAQAIASSDLLFLKTTALRRKTLIAFSNAILQKKLSLESTQNIDDFLKNILELPGIGSWTAQYIALKALRHTDAFPATDLILARALDIHSRETIQKMSPWRGYVAALLWREYTPLLTKQRKKKS